MRGPGGRAAPAALVVASLALLSGCVATVGRGDAGPHRLPLGIPEPAVARCEQGAGLGESTPTVVWRDTVGLHVRLGVGSARSPKTSAVASTTEQALVSCLMVATGTVEPYPADSAGRLLLWKYSVGVLWPCLAQHGVDAGSVPDRAAFLAGDPLQIDPYDRVASHLSRSALQALKKDCPAVPDYLRLATGPGPTASG